MQDLALCIHPKRIEELLLNIPIVMFNWPELEAGTQSPLSLRGIAMRMFSFFLISVRGVNCEPVLSEAGLPKMQSLTP